MTSGGSVNINPDEVHGGANSLGSFADEASGHLDRLSQTSDRVSSHARGDRSGVGKVIEEGVTKATTVMANTGKQVIRVVKGSEQRLHAGTDAHVENENKQKGILDGIHPEDKKITPKSETEGGSSSSSTSTSSTQEPPKPKGESGADAKPPLHEANKPPSATNNHSQQFTDRPNLPKAEKFAGDLPDSNPQYGLPPDKGRGAKVEQIDKSRTTRDSDGLITHVDGKPVKQYLGELSEKKAQDAADPTQAWKNANPGAKKVPKGVPGKEKVCSALAIDRRTGLVTQGVNGKATDVIPEKNLHPLLQDNYQNLRGWQHEVKKPDGNSDYLDGKAHESVPANHAEVKAVNELLWQRESKLEPGQSLGADTLKEIGFDPRWTKDTGHGTVGGEAPACANCNTILHGATSYTGRYQHAPMDVRYKDTQLPPEQ